MLMLRHDQTGVSLTELIIVIAVVGTLATLAVPNFTTWIQNTRIRTAAETIQNGLQLARGEAVRRNTLARFQLVDTLTSSCTISSTGTNWVVSLDDATANCGNAPTADLDTPVTPRIIQKRSTAVASSNNATITATPAAAKSVIFNSLGRVTNSPAGCNDSRFDIGHANGCTWDSSGSVASKRLRCLRVVISLGGQVRMCDPAIAVTDPPDPQACPAVAGGC